jgi:hypothetical protein
MHRIQFSIDDDILDLIDEVKIDMFLKEASDAIDDADKLADFIREKASIAVERFLVSKNIGSLQC